MLHKLLDTADDLILTLLRLTLGGIFFAHGAQKMLGWFGGNGFNATMNGFEQMGIPAVFAFLAIAAEFFGAIGLLLGLLGRVAAFGIVVNMIVAILMVHGRFGLFMNWFGNQPGEGIEYHLLAIAIGIAIVIRGSGAFSIDHLMSRSATHVGRAQPTVS
jgi:putative oxidoreductase